MRNANQAKAREGVRLIGNEWMRQKAMNLVLVPLSFCIALSLSLLLALALPVPVLSPPKPKVRGSKWERERERTAEELSLPVEWSKTILKRVPVRKE